MQHEDRESSSNIEFRWAGMTERKTGRLKGKALGLLDWTADAHLWVPLQIVGRLEWHEKALLEVITYASSIED